MSQIEKGSTCTPYVPYKNIIKNDGIKEEVMPKILRRIKPLEKQISQLFEKTRLFTLHFAKEIIKILKTHNQYLNFIFV